MDADDGSRATAAPALEAVAASFKSKVMELQDLVLARNMFPATVEPELGNVDSLVTAMENQVRTMRLRIQEELDAIPKAKKLVMESLKQQEKLQHMLANLPSRMPKATHPEHSSLRMEPQCSNFDSSVTEASKCDVRIKDEPVAVPRKGKSPAPRWYVSTEELDSLSSYMRGRLTLEKVNIAINEVASYADVNVHLITCPSQKLSEDTRGKALELRDLAAKEALKGKYFFLESDIKGPGLKLDITGKAILTVLRHLGRFHEVRIGPHRVFILSKQS